MRSARKKVKNIAEPKSDDWVWVPNQSLGPVFIGSKIENYIGVFALTKDTTVDATGWDTYVFPNHNIYIDTDNGKVVSITSYSEFFYKGQNLIGLGILELSKLFGVDPDEIGDPVEYEDGDIKQPFEYFDLGLQVWMSDGTVTSVSCMCYEEE